ncbi:hypothetical protein MJO28_006511 [Puccinia striiformis f. sp. tritici]|uniref:Uncharacterized protein n=1 Tax=Puccinia striiformis f. sp. tritici TaxID=168172 RepID=A0ACC0EIL7_9BASI|nr:hypothetical protein Pst134EB_012659 [Puccinia striiformis f. sp. tritici]KAI7953964.1 hypothetical protein MJO28_006511 [Puccinia striiformis f. sp. tritici]KAI7958271.1 hypothetical protein MJO29_006488 [Puccinia striiformis f. sp. tritici]
MEPCTRTQPSTDKHIRVEHYITISTDTMEGALPPNPFGHQPNQSNSSYQHPSSNQRTWNQNNQSRRGQHHQPYRSQKPRGHSNFNRNQPRQNSHNHQPQNRPGGNETWFKNSMLQDPWLSLYNR